MRLWATCISLLSDKTTPTQQGERRGEEEGGRGRKEGRKGRAGQAGAGRGNSRLPLYSMPVT